MSEKDATSTYIFVQCKLVWHLHNGLVNPNSRDGQSVTKPPGGQRSLVTRMASLKSKLNPNSLLSPTFATHSLDSLEPENISFETSRGDSECRLKLSVCLSYSIGVKFVVTRPLISDLTSLQSHPKSWLPLCIVSPVSRPSIPS